MNIEKCKKCGQEEFRFWVESIASGKLVRDDKTLKMIDIEGGINRGVLNFREPHQIICCECGTMAAYKE